MNKLTLFSQRALAAVDKRIDVIDKIAAILLAFCPLLQHYTGLVYNALVDGLMTKLIKTAKGERAKTLVKWLNDGACLLKFEPPLEFKNYEI